MGLNVCHPLDLERSRYDFGAFHLVLTREPANDSMSRHAHEMSSISVVLGGVFAEEAQHRETIPFAGSVGIKPAGAYHANRFGPRDVSICRVDVFEWDETVLPYRSALSTYSWRWNAHAVTRVRTALRGRTRLDSDDARLLAIDLLELMTPKPEERRVPRWLRDVSSALLSSAEFRQWRSVAELARGAGVHRGSLARRFRDVHGFSIRDARRRLMIERAAHAIVRGRASLSAIAHDCGFADHAHMTRAIHSAIGETPTRLRRLSREG